MDIGNVRNSIHRGSFGIKQLKTKPVQQILRSLGSDGNKEVNRWNLKVTNP